MALLRQILVEGKDDAHVIRNLLAAQGIVHQDGISCELLSLGQRARAHDEKIYIIERGGYEQLHESLPETLNTPGLTHLAIVVDADTNLATRWQSLKDRVDPIVLLPDAPDVHGTTLNINHLGRQIRVGVWLMPNNTTEGMIKDFVLLLVPPPHKRLWNYVQKAVAKIPIKLFIDDHKAKAEIHTWLAWQKEPGTPMGQAITARYLDANRPEANQFISWLPHVLNL